MRSVPAGWHEAVWHRQSARSAPVGWHEGVWHRQSARSAPARTSQAPNQWAPHTATLALVGTPLNPMVPAVGPGGRPGPTLHPKQVQSMCSSP